MKTTFWIRRVLLLSVFILLLAIPGNTDASFFIGGPLIISADSEQEVSPSIAYNNQHLEYLVVWYNDRASCDDIRAQRVSVTGELAGSPFYISAGCNLDRRFPDVVYNSVHDQYLVVWEQYDPGTTWYSIQGRRVSGSGQLLDATDITIRSASNLYTPTRPAVAYGSTSDRYLVVWAETWHPTPITYDIYGQAIDHNGNLDGSRFSITTGTKSKEEPDVAYNQHTNRFLVVWQEITGIPYCIYGQQVHNDGSLYQSVITIAYYIVSSISPAVAAIPTSPTNEKFLVVWELLYDTNDHDIYGQLVGEDSTAYPDIYISVTTLDETSPAITVSEDNLTYFVAWRSSEGVMDNPIKGTAISYSGAFVGGAIEAPGVDANYPALAVGPTSDILAVWQDQPVGATNTHLFGQLLGNLVFLPIILRD
ncbi:MAG: hypothetical protein JW908_16915 [Anaerolineales bacterium]|nr:hypothetical protein [Anaerolineales bacterium]